MGRRSQRIAIRPDRRRFAPPSAPTWDAPSAGTPANGRGTARVMARGSSRRAKSSPGRPKHHYPRWSDASVREMAAEKLRAYADVNAVIGGYLRDLAFAQSSQPKMFGYKRAAAAILALDVPLTELIGASGALPRISGIGPGSTRIIREILETGASPTVERA